MGKVWQETLFDIDEITAVNQQLIADKERDKREEIYQGAELPWYDNPQNDNERMFNLQFRYLKEKDTAARDELYTLGYKVLYRLLWAEMKKGIALYGNVKKESPYKYLDEEQQADIVSNAFIYVFRRYEKGLGYTVDKNFICVLRGGIRHALEYRTMASEEVSLDSFKKDPTHRVEKVF